MTNALTIGQLASLLDVTAKTIRHYHKKGLLDEPDRDHSGYRRYRSRDVLRLVQVRTLAKAGVPLAEIADLLTQEPSGFESAIDQIEEQLDQKIQELRQRRAMLARIRKTGVSELPPAACSVLEDMKRLEFAPAFLEVQKDAMKLAAALAPELLDTLLAQLKSRLADPEHAALLKQLWAASSWGAHDPGLEVLAEKMAKNLLADPKHLQHGELAEPIVHNSKLYRLINHFAEMPGASALTRRIEAHLRKAGLDVPSC